MPTFWPRRTAGDGKQSTMNLLHYAIKELEKKARVPRDRFLRGDANTACTYCCPKPGVNAILDIDKGTGCLQEGLTKCKNIKLTRVLYQHRTTVPIGY